MRLLFVIPHVFAAGDGANGSLGPSPRPRVAALTACIGALHQTFGTRQYTIDYTRHRAVPVAAEDESAVDVVVCTARGRHLLDRLALPAEAYVHVPLDVDPLLLGFECRDVLRE